MTYSGIKLSRSCQNLMIAHAQQTFPEECCGTLLGRDLDSGVREVLQIIRVENTKDENRTRRYLISPQALLQAEKTARQQKLDVVGIYHSHPNHPSTASEFDREHAMPYWSYVIHSCMNGKVVQSQSWRLRDDRSSFDEEIIIIADD